MLFLIIFATFLLCIVAMSIGVIISNKPIKGSCGGLQQLGVKGKCSICGAELNNKKDCKQTDSNN